jgi:hypothetical protein
MGTHHPFQNWESKAMSLDKSLKGSVETSIVDCPICETGKLTVFFVLAKVPIFSNIIQPSKEAALNCPKGDVKLAYCLKCGYIGNIAFEQHLVDYEQELYENSLDFSSHYRHYSLSLARKMIKRYDLYKKDIIGIGSGNGKFLNTLCELGNNRGVGFDPSYAKRGIPVFKNSQVSFVNGYYSPKYRNYPVDLIACRQTLEHVPAPKSFLLDLRNTIGNRHTAIFFEVPNAINILSADSCWDIIYEHNSYFTSDSLFTIFLLSRFRVCEITETFGGQFLCVYAEPNHKHEYKLNNKKKPSKKIVNYTDSLFANWQNKTNMFRNTLEEIRKDRQRCIVWGAGSKAVTFLNVFKDAPIEYAVDLNPHKQGNYIEGTGQQIVPPEFLLRYKPDVTIIMNPIYTKEIEALLREMGISSRIISA